MPSHLDANGFVRLDNDDDHQARAAAITACQLCDDHGYRGAFVCNHTDHQAAAKRGMDMVRRLMGWPS